MMPAMDRWILHVDMDEFFAAVEKLDRPELRGKCLLIGGSAEGRGVVSTASYEARQFGCHSAMPMAAALRLCPQATVLPVRGRRYRQISDRVFEILGRYSPLLEPLSIDEAFVDVTGCRRLHGAPEQIGRAVKRTIREELGLVASVGAAPNKFLAKLASDLEKPDGFVIVEPGRVQALLDPLPVRRLWGVGPAAEKRLAKLGIRTVRQLRQTGDALTDVLGRAAAEHLLALAEGRDVREVVPDHRAKSIGQEQTFAEDVEDLDALRSVLLHQADEVARRLRRCDLEARTVTLKLRYGDFTTLTRSTTLERPTHVTQQIWSAAGEVFEAWARRSFGPLRLLGVTASHLTARAGRQLALFEDPDAEKLRRVDRAVDEIAERFGQDAIRRGS